MKRIARFLQSVRGLPHPVPILLAGCGLALSAVTGGFILSRVTMPATDAAADGYEDFSSTKPSRELSPASRNLLLNIEITAGLQSARLADVHPDFGDALAQAAQMTADATSLGAEVPAALREFLLSNIETSMSALHAGNAAEAKGALDLIKSRLNTYRMS